MIWHWISAAVMVVVAVLHSTGGAQSVLEPMLAKGNPLPEMAIAPALLRFCWHALSLLMLFSALVVAWPGTHRIIVIAAGTVWIGMAVADIVTSRFEHPGWVPMGIAGAFALIGAFR